jgi:hypothetical protein
MVRGIGLQLRTQTHLILATQASRQGIEIDQPILSNLAFGTQDSLCFTTGNVPIDPLVTSPSRLADLRHKTEVLVLHNTF